MNLKIKLRFLKYAFVTIGVTIFVFSILLLLGLDFLIPFGFMISIKYITQILESYTDRKNTYIRLYNQFNKNPNDIKKSIFVCRNEKFFVLLQVISCEMHDSKCDNVHENKKKYGRSTVKYWVNV